MELLLEAFGNKLLCAIAGELRLDGDSVKNMVQEHLNGEENRRPFIWFLINFK
jgi:hypothetical protein